MDKKKKIIVDMGLNIVASAIPVFVLQLLVLPSLAGQMTDDKYGLLVTILSLLNMIPASLGNVLNNIRLIFNKDQTEVEKKNDYNAELLLMVLFNIVIVLVFSIYYAKTINVFDLILTVIVSILWLAREYYIVAFRLQINYIYITISNLIMIPGYAAGYALFLITNSWQYIYILGYVFSISFIFIKSDLWKEPFAITPKFKKITTQSALLFIANFFTRLTTYADKMLIYPILGGATVSIYYVATLFGKVVSMAITPVSSVLLSYLSKENSKNDRAFGIAFSCSSIVCVIGYIICVLISRPLLGLIYPQFVDEAMKYIFITTGTVVVTALISMINPFVLKFFDMKWQVAINALYALMYVSISLGLLHFWGLYGFCAGTLISAIVKMIFMLIVYLKGKERINE